MKCSVCGKLWERILLRERPGRREELWKCTGCGMTRYKTENRNNPNPERRAAAMGQ